MKANILACLVLGLAVLQQGSFVSASQLERRVYEGWFLGFVSGAGQVRANEGPPLIQTDSKGITEWAAKYCADHPLDSIVKAAISLVSELSPRRSGQ